MMNDITSQMIAKLGAVAVYNNLRIFNSKLPSKLISFILFSIMGRRTSNMSLFSPHLIADTNSYRPTAIKLAFGSMLQNLS
jgi:hypothetical protein